MSNKREEFYEQISDKDEERKFGSELEPQCQRVKCKVVCRTLFVQSSCVGRIT